MIRREFLKKLLPAALGTLFFESRGIFARVLPNWWNSQASELMVYREGSSYGTPIPTWLRQNNLYVGAEQFARALDFHTYLNEAKRKLVIYLPENKIIVTADNPFVIIDNRSLQMPVACMWEQKNIYIPLVHLVGLVNRYSSLSLNYDETRRELRTGSAVEKTASGETQAGLMEIDQKKNGIVIRIGVNRKLEPSEMKLNTRYNWLHVDLHGANGNIAALNRTPVQGKIRELKALQLDRTLSLSFRLSQLPTSSKIYQDQYTREVVIILRYEAELAEADLPELDTPAEQPLQEAPPDAAIQKQLEKERKRWLIDTVVIDAGHGGKDPGAIGVGKLKEKDVVLAVALKLGALIEKKLPGIKVVYTRTDDRFIELRQRTQIANESNAKVFISIHANANASANASGFETYILGPEKGAQASNVAARENSVIQFESAGSQQHYEGINAILAGMAQSAFMRQSEHLASGVQTEMGKRLRSLNLKNRGVKQAGFWVMVGASMPSILVEIGFITNKYESRIMKTASHQQKIAEGIFYGLEQYKRDHENAI